MHTQKPLVIALMGPTASGKTSLAIDIATKLQLSIHNVDSRQIYIDMDIGTAKPTKKQQSKVSHYLIDLCHPNEQMTLYEFQKIANRSLKKNIKKNNLIFLVGGSGLYTQSLTGRLKPPAVPPQNSFRKQLQQFDKVECHQLLENCDPVAAKRISPTDSVRTIRALEVFYATGKPISQIQTTEPPPWKVLELGLNPANLTERIAKRTEEIYKNGLVEETERLIYKYGIDLPLLKTIGYGEATLIIKGEISLMEAITITTKRTSQFAKRQKTWFRNKHNPKWLNSDHPLIEALSLIEEALS